MVTVRTDSYRINFGIQKDLQPRYRPDPTVDARTHARAIYTLVIHRATFLFAAFYPLVRCIRVYKNEKIAAQVQTPVLTMYKVLFL